MTINELKSYGGYQIAKAAAIVFLLTETVCMFFYVQGDFANGILFFIGDQVNLYFLTAILLSFITLYKLGSILAEKVANKKAGLIKKAGLFSIVAALFVIVYFAIAIYMLNESREPGFNKQHKNEILSMLLRIGLILILPMFLVGYYGIKKIKAEALRYLGS